MDLQRRIELLERERWMYLGLGLLGALAGLAGVGVAALKGGGELSTSALMLRDPQGVQRARLSVDSNGTAALSFFDGKGAKTIHTLGATKSGESQQLMYTSTGSPLVWLRASDAAYPRLDLYNPGSTTPRSTLMIDTSGGLVSVSDSLGTGGQVLNATGVKPTGGAAKPAVPATKTGS